MNKRYSIFLLLVSLGIASTALCMEGQRENDSGGDSAARNNESNASWLRAFSQSIRESAPNLRVLYCGFLGLLPDASAQEVQQRYDLLREADAVTPNQEVAYNAFMSLPSNPTLQAVVQTNNQINQGVRQLSRLSDTEGETQRSILPRQNFIEQIPTLQPNNDTNTTVALYDVKRELQGQDQNEGLNFIEALQDTSFLQPPQTHGLTAGTNRIVQLYDAPREEQRQGEEGVDLRLLNQAFTAGQPTNNMNALIALLTEQLQAPRGVGSSLPMQDIMQQIIQQPVTPGTTVVVRYTKKTTRRRTISRTTNTNNRQVPGMQNVNADQNNSTPHQN